MIKFLPPVSVRIGSVTPSRWDLVAILLVLGFIVFFAEASRGLLAPLVTLRTAPISLDPANLPVYALRTALRMLAALGLSLGFTFTYATLAAKSRRAEVLLVPLLDVLQSVPILGFISITVVFFMSLAPGRVLGAEFAAVFAIFTSQAWNMAFSFYQSLRTVPSDLIEASRCFRLSAWTRFWRVEVPFAMPALIWNMMVSISGGWFFVVASEAISIGNTTVTLPGIGSYIATAIEHRDLASIGWAIGTMLVVILIFDQILFRPLVAWADRFRFEQETGVAPPESWVLDALRRSRIFDVVGNRVSALFRPVMRFVKTPAKPAARAGIIDQPWFDNVWYALLGVMMGLAIYQVGRYVLSGLAPTEIAHALIVALATMIRMFVLIALASVIWVPIGVWIGLRPTAARFIQPIVQFLAAFPANLFFPLVVLGIVAYKLNPDIWLSPLMILGTQWYILFNVIAGASALPSELRNVSRNLGIGGWLWWRKVALPGVFPYYLTGAITASGGSWNASIVAEYASWGDTTEKAHGIGSYIAEATAAGDFPRIVLGIAVMSGLVVLINRAFWRPLYRRAERKFRLD